MKIGVMNDPGASVYAEVKAIGRAGFDFVDLTLEGPTLDLDVERLKEILDRFGLLVVGHTDPCLPYAYPVEAIRAACFQELKRCAKLFSALGAKVMNIHPCYTAPPRMKGRLLEFNIEALRPICRMAADQGLTLVLENYKPPFDRVFHFQTIFKEVPGLGLHLDFGHTNMGRDPAEAFCKHLGNQVLHVHFSDNRATEDHHMPLGVGSVDWVKAIASLKAIDYDGTITLEVFCDNSDVLFSYLDVSRNLVTRLWDAYNGI